MTTPPHERPRPAAAAVLMAAVAVGTGAHLTAALGASGAMAWTMAAMGIACLSCLLHLRGSLGPGTVHRAAGHLMAMTLAMIAVHLLWLVSMGTGSAGHSHGAPTPGPAAVGLTSHATAMLVLIGVELVCLALGAAVLRRARNPRPRTLSAPAAQLA